MTFTLASPVVVKVEVNLGALGWVDVTSRGRKASCVIQQGRSANAKQAETSRLNLTLGNPDGWLTEGNPVSPWYPAWGRGCEIRVSRPDLTGAPQRFHGRVDMIEEAYPGGNLDATVEVTAVGTLGQIVQGADPLRSALTRAMDGISEGDFRPVAHWPMEGGPDTTTFGSLVPGVAAAQVSGDVSPGSYSAAPGSAPVPLLNATGLIYGEFPAVTLAPNGDGDRIWQFQFMGMVPSTTSLDTFFGDISVPDTGGDHIVRMRIIFQTGLELFTVRLYDRTGAQFGPGIDIDFSASTGSPQLYDNPALYGISVYELGASPGAIGVQFAAFLPGSAASPLEFGLSGFFADSLPAPRTWSAFAGVTNVGWSFSHAALYTDAAIIFEPNQQNNADAIDGYSGETAGARMVRLCREEGIGFELVGDADDTVAMGPQPTDTLEANLRDCENADQGLMHDNGTDGALVYRTRTDLYNQTASVAIARGSLEPNLRAVRDNRYAANDVTSTRPNGGSARVVDTDHVALVGGRLKGSRTANVHTDAQLADDAAWAVHVGVAPGARYNSVGINLRNADGAELADQVAAHAIGDRLTAATTALPPQHTDSIDGLTVGWTEALDADTWRFRPNLMPYSPYDVAVYDEARYDSKYTYLIEDLDETETAVDVVTRDGKLPWSTTSSGYLVAVGGEHMLVSSVAALASDAYGRTVANGWGSADTGQAYTVTGTASDYAVAAGVATQTHTAVNSLHAAVLDVGSPDQDFTWDCRLAIGSASGAEARHWVAARYADANNYYLAVLALTTSATVTLAVGKRVAGVLSFLTGSMVVATGHAGGETYRVRLQAMGSTIRARAWLSSDVEPSIWHWETTDTVLTSGASIAAMSRLETGNTNTLPLAFTFDNLTLRTPQRFTVQRAANGITKSHSSGAQLRLARPPYFAY